LFIFLWVFCAGRVLPPLPKGGASVRRARPTGGTPKSRVDLGFDRHLRVARPPQKSHKKYFSKATHEIPRTPKDECLTPPELRERSERVKNPAGGTIPTWSSPVAPPWPRAWRFDSSDGLRGARSRFWNSKAEIGQCYALGNCLESPCAKGFALPIARKFSCTL